MRILSANPFDLASHFHDPLAYQAPAPSGDATQGDDNLKGTSGDDELYGWEGNDTLSGLAGADTLNGGEGNDSLVGGSGDDFLFDNNWGSDTLLGGAGEDDLQLDHFLGFEASEHILIDGGDDADHISLQLSSDDGSVLDVDATVLGGAGDDFIELNAIAHVTVDAGTGDDVITTLQGQDVTLTLGGGADIVGFSQPFGESVLTITDFATGDAGDRLELSDFLSQALSGWDHSNPFGEGGYLRLVQRGGDVILQIDADGGANGWVDMVDFQGAGKTSFTAFNLGGYDPDGSELAGELITGSDDRDFLEGTDGADTIKALAGADQIYGGAGADLIFGGEGDDEVNGGFGADTINGGDGDDWLSSEDADRLIGGEGDDRLSIFAFTTPGLAVLDGGAGDDLIEVEVDEGSLLKVSALGGEGDDVLTVHGDGYVTLNGGKGADDFTVSGRGDHTVLTLGDGADTVHLDTGYPFDPLAVTITDFEVGDAGDRLDLYQMLASRLEDWDRSSNPFADGFLRLTQKGSTTFLQYHPNADEGWLNLVGLKGVQAGDLTAFNLSGYPSDGSDPAGLNIKGTAGDDFIDGTNLYDTISGGVGDDFLNGFSGDDVLSGGKGGDRLDGGLGLDRLVGGGGDDALSDDVGNGGTLLGGAGDDSFFVGGFIDYPVSGAVTSINGGAGADYVEVTGDFSDAVSVFVDGGIGNDTLVVDARGTALMTVHGGAGNDEIDLTAGAFTVDAGDGNDRVVLEGVFGGTRLTLGGGTDTVFVQTFNGESPAAEILDFGSKDVLDLSNFSGGEDPFDTDQLRLSQDGDTAVVLSRNGTSWEEVIRLDGVDAFHLSAKQLGGFGPGDVWLMGTAGEDTLTAKGDLTHLDGLQGDDVLKGSGGDDVLNGGIGADTLTGGGGSDTFVYESFIYDGDTIADLTNADVIDLSRVDANVFWDGDQAFVLVSAFDGTAGELMLTKSGKLTLIQGDYDGDKFADFTITVNGDHTDFTNFVL